MKEVFHGGGGDTITIHFGGVSVNSIASNQNMKTTAIVYEQHQEVARISIDKIEYIYPLVDGIRVTTSIPEGNGYESYEGDEIEFV